MSTHRSIPTVDRIRDLPDSVISHILSFLPTKQSAATSILSKRWNPLWFSVLTLDFDDQNFKEFATFRHFVYLVITLRNITQTIQSFSLKGGKSSGFDLHDVDRFIHAAVQRGIQNLNLEISRLTLGFKLPLCVFSCRNITTLKLKRLTISFSSDFNFPLLKTLHLDIISFGCCYGFLRLLNGCPISEDLETNNLLVYTSGGHIDSLKVVSANILNLSLRL